MALLGKPLISYKHMQLTADEAIGAYKDIFKTLEPILKGDAEPRDTETKEFHNRIVQTLNNFEADKIGIWTAVDEIASCIRPKSAETHTRGS